MDSMLEKIEEEAHVLVQLLRGFRDNLEVYTGLVKIAVEVAIFAILFYMTSELIEGMWRLAQNSMGPLIQPS